jgi:hypothetical protein
MPRRLEIDLDTVSAQTAARTPQTIIGFSFAMRFNLSNYCARIQRSLGQKKDAAIG